MSADGATRWIVALTSVALLTVAGTTIAFTSSNVIAPSKISDRIVAVGVNNFSPPECAHMSFDNLIVGNGGGTSGTSQRDLILGTGETDYIFAGSGNDCLVGGGGNDFFFGGGGNDVCVGGAGWNYYYPGQCETEV